MTYMIDEPIEVQLDAAISLLKLQYSTLERILKMNWANPYALNDMQNMMKDRKDKISDFLVSMRKL